MMLKPEDHKRRVSCPTGSSRPVLDLVRPSLKITAPRRVKGNGSVVACLPSIWHKKERKRERKTAIHSAFVYF